MTFLQSYAKQWGFVSIKQGEIIEEDEASSLPSLSVCLM